MKERLKFSFLIFFILSSQISPQVKLTDAFPNLNFTYSFPSDIQNAGDGTNRLFVTQNNGLVFVMPNDTSITAIKIFLDIRDRVANPSDGLLGMAFHPDYQNNGYFYLKYICAEGDTFCNVIARYSVSATNPDSANKNSELILLKVPQSTGIHCGGSIIFGPSDGYFYITMGDGGPQGDPNNHGQNLETLLGTVLRIDIDNPSGNLNYGIPNDNPFVGNPNGYREEIYAYGFRNPWRLSFDIATNLLWLGDVGHASYEEINIVQKGKNYGWKIMEGFHCYSPPSGCDTSGLELPIWEYSHNGASASIAGGYVYRGTEIPDIVGSYIYADSPTGRIWALKYDGINPPENVLLLDTQLYITSFGLDENDELLLCAIDEKIYRLKAQSMDIKDEPQMSSQIFKLTQNYPNPFNSSTRITYNLPKVSKVLLSIYNILGQEVRTLVNEKQPAGEKSAIWDGRDNYGNPVNSGIFIYQIQVSGAVESRKMILIR